MNKRPTIMIVDDDINFLNQFREMLDLAGYATVVFPNGNAALKALRNDQQPDLILLDLKMEEQDGLEVVKVIREELGLHHIPIIVMSAFFTDYPVTGIEKDWHIQRCLPKPIKPLDVIAEIETAFIEN